MITKLMIAIVVILLCMGAACLFLNLQEKNKKLEKQNKEFQTAIDLLEKNQSTLQKNQEQYARLYHDYKNHAICMQRLIEQKKYNDLEVYLKGIQRNYFCGKLEYVPPTGNAMLDAVLSVKFTRCKELDIHTFSTLEGNFAHMDNFHVIIVLLNILDNAIEASCREESDRRIYVALCRKEKHVNILVKNKIAVSVLETNPGLKTTKKEAQMHGIGTQEIQEITDAANGLTAFWEENGFFCVSVLLPI